jgi:FAD dependent oxidoreductase TIGR03364
MPAATLDVSSAGGRVKLSGQKNRPRVRSRTHIVLTGGYDVAIVGAGIVGLAHALAAARLGKRVVVVDREARANGASVRNFGFVTVTGQGSGDAWRRACRSRDVWDEIAPLAAIAIEQRGLLVTLRFPESLDVAEAFLATEMGAGCRLLTPAEVGRRWPQLRPGGLLGALHSERDLRVDSRLAIPRLAAWLEREHGVTFMYRTAVHDVAPPRLETSRGTIRAACAVVCPGDDTASLFADRLAAHDVRRCSLSMLRLADPGLRLPLALMSDLSLVRYLGYSRLPQARSLADRLQASHAQALAEGVHLIVVQGADGELIVGDSHHYDEIAPPFMRAGVERLILDEFEAATGLAAPAVVERWTGSYAWSPHAGVLIDTPSPDVRLVVVTAGNGASTAFALAEEVTADLFGAPKRIPA